MARKAGFPRRLYVRREEDGGEVYFPTYADGVNAKDFEDGEEVAVYELVEVARVAVAVTFK